MTEKRFTHKKWYNERQLFDGDEPFAIVDVWIQADKICDKLNEQHELIEYLKPLANENAQYIADMEDDIATFKEEIQQLKSSNMELEDYLARLEEENQRLLSANTKLTEENTNIYQTIRQAYQNERTQIGRMVLKQLLDNLE